MKRRQELIGKVIEEANIHITRKYIIPHFTIRSIKYEYRVSGKDLYVFTRDHHRIVVIFREGEYIPYTILHISIIERILSDLCRLSLLYLETPKS